MPVRQGARRFHAGAGSLELVRGVDGFANVLLQDLTPHRTSFYMKQILIVLLFIAQWQLAYAEIIEYEIYELSKGSEARKLIAKGKREYSLKDIEVHTYQHDGRQIAEKLVELEQGYRVGARIFYERELSGFGLLARRSNADFSWEWYNKQTGNRFRKLQGGTHVTVQVTGQPMVEELAEVKFLEDANLRFIANRQGMDDTHSIIVKAGSVLRLR